MLRNVGMYECVFAGRERRGVNAALKEKQIRDQDSAISNQHLVCKFEEMG